MPTSRSKKSQQQQQPDSPTTTTTTRSSRRAKPTTTPSSTSSPTAQSTSPPPRQRRRRKSESTTMNNAENHATVEVKRKAAMEDSRYELAERGESNRVRGNFEKLDKPDDSPERPTEHHRDSLGSLPPEDLRNVGILMILYLLQGIPVGLAFGSVPFLLKARLSYGQVGIFSLASYPYSMKLLWSPIVDAIYSRRIGRRKSWIVPIQATSGLLLLWLGSHIEGLMTDAEHKVGLITCIFFVLVFLCATQDVAVDGWALTLLSTDNLSYASTAQTIGLNTGYFLSFTVFLAFNSPEFANKYFRSTPLEYGLVSLGGYLKFWGWLYLLVTVWLARFKKEEQTKTDDGGVKAVYQTIWSIMKLSHVRTLMIVLLLSKFGFQANEAVTNLKLLEKGFSREDLAITVLIDFPFSILFGYYAAKWSTGPHPLKPWMLAFMGRLLSAVINMGVVAMFPKGGVGMAYFILVIIAHVSTSFMSTVMFVSSSAFYTQIADPVIGGTYLTLLNTVSNLGGTWPRYFVLRGVDFFTRATCILPENSELESKTPTSSKRWLTTVQSCATEPEKLACLAAEGECHKYVDGYYIVNTLCVGIAFAMFMWYIRPRVTKLQGINQLAWKIPMK